MKMSLALLAAAGPSVRRCRGNVAVHITGDGTADFVTKPWTLSPDTAAGGSD
jgi:hypothetical protein